MIFLPQFINEGIYKERIPTINYLFIPRVKMGFPGNSAGKETACNAGDPGLIPWWRSSPVEGISYPLQYFSPSLVAVSKKSTCSEDLGLSLGWEDPLEEGMTIHSSTLAWRIPIDREA